MNPKLLTLNAPTVRNQKTLICLQKGMTSKWDAVVDIKSYHPSNKNVGIIAIDPDIDFDELHTMKHIHMILLSQKVLSQKPQEYWLQYDNILDLNHLEQYPFIEPWDGTFSDAVAIVALLLRYNRIINCSVSDKRLAFLTTHNITITNNIRNETWLFTQFFKHKDKKRFEEIKECLRRNCACPDIDRIVLINEMDYSKDIPRSDKIHQIVTGRRLIYSDFLQYVYYSVPKNVYTVLCNADIYFEDLSDLHKINMENRMFGLLRWDVDTEGNATIFGPRADSQDTWIFLSDSIKSRTWDYKKFSFQLGQAGCDNAFAGHILRNKFVITNPGISLKSYHLHNTNIRNYDKKDYIRSDVYINIVPTYIIDTRQEKPTNPIMLSNETASFEIKGSSMSDEITYCTMLEKEGRYKWEPCVENYYFDNISLYKWANVGVTPNGLVFDLYSIYTGHEEYNYWENANIDILTPLQSRDKIFAIPFKNMDVFKNPDAYILNYISRCVRLLSLYPGTALWVPKDFTEYLEYFDWSILRGERLKACIFDENTACWAKEVIGFLPGPNELGIEDIDALRSLYPAWISTPQNICSIVIGSITQEFAETLSTFIKSKTEYEVRFVHEDHCSYDSIIGSSLCIVMDHWSKLWALPKGCRVIEFQQELKISGEFQHLAHVAGFTSWVLLLSKGSMVDVQEQMMEHLERWFQKNGNSYS